jgi:hypothetical protein
MKHLYTAVVMPVVWLCLGLVSMPAAAQVLQAKSPIVFDSFTGNYFLSRDSSGHSLLTSDEVILADFPADESYTGITRAIPKRYQGHNVTVKVLSVKDAGGDAVQYKTSSDKNGNLVITTGSPSITLYGSQTFRIDYQTKDVVDTGSPTDQFRLDVNGRGWSQPFGSVTGILSIPNSFSSTIIGRPSCYIGYQAITSNDCSVTSTNMGSQMVITAKSNGQLPAAHTLVIKTAFKPATFTKPAKSSNLSLIIAGTIIGLAVITGVYWLTRRLI